MPYRVDNISDWFPLVVGQSLRSIFPVLGYDQVPFTNIVSISEIVEKKKLREMVLENGLTSVIPSNAPVMLDSGGYQLLSRGKHPLELYELIEFYRRARPRVAVSLDEPILMDHSFSVASAIAKRNMLSYRIMLDKLPLTHIVPVIHGFDPELIVQQCNELYACIPEPSLIGLGGNVPIFKALTRNAKHTNSRLLQRALFSAFVQRLHTVNQHFPTTGIHIFGAGGYLSIAMSLLAGCTTVDSAGWRVRAAYGCVMLRKGRQVRLGCNQRKGAKLTEMLSREKWHCKCPICSDSENATATSMKLQACFKDRAQHNLWVLVEDVKELLSIARTTDDPGKFAQIVFEEHKWIETIAMEYYDK